MIRVAQGDWKNKRDRYANLERAYFHALGEREEANLKIA